MQELTFFKLVDAKLDYTSQRQAQLALNVSNANTPGYRAMDVKAPDFKAILAGRTDAPRGLATTNVQHITGRESALGPNDIDISDTYEVSPNGNSVDLEEQMLKSGQNSADANITMNLYTKQMTMMRIALGVNGR